MSTRNRLLIGGAVLLVLLFAAAVGCGGGGDGDPTPPRGGPVGLLGDWFGDAAAADPRDVSGDCLAPDGQLTVTGSCRLTVAPTGGRLRLVRLRAEQAASVTAALPGLDRTATTDLAAGETTRVAVDGDGGPIEITCAGPGPCVLRLLGRS